MTVSTFVRVRLHPDGTPSCAGLKHFRFGHVLARTDSDNPDGVFGEWTWDGETLRARSGRYAIAPLYYTRLDDGVMLAPSIADLIALGASPALDFDALSVLLRFGQPLEEDTPFAAIRALPPSGRLTWRAGVLKVDGHYPRIKPQSISRPVAIDSYIDLFRAAIMRRPSNGRLILPLSGGRDSRHIFLELCRQGRKPEACVTSRGYVDASMAGEAALAARLSADFGVPHHVIDAPADRVEAKISVIIQANLGTLEHGWALSLANFLEARADVTFDGLAGDVLSGSRFFSRKRLDALAALDAPRFARSVFVTDEYHLGMTIAPWLYREIPPERAMARLAKAMPRHLAAANPLSSFYFWSRTRRNVAQYPYGLLRGVRTVYAPFLDWDIYDLLASLDPTLTETRMLHTDAIARAYPEARNIPYSEGWSDSDDGAVARHHLGNIESLARRLIKAAPGSFVNRRALLPRLAWHAMARSARTAAPAYLPLACYLLALEQVTRGEFGDLRRAGATIPAVFGLTNPLFRALSALA
ncbi:MAG: hypothetical protein U1E97_11360 [Alphaproteobacteria bacterium]